MNHPGGRPEKKLINGYIFCMSCDILKLKEDFYKDNRSKCGYQTKCKQCLKDYYKKNRARYQAIKRLQKHKDKSKSSAIPHSLIVINLSLIC